MGPCPRGAGRGNSATMTEGECKKRSKKSAVILKPLVRVRLCAMVASTSSWILGEGQCEGEV